MRFVRKTILAAAAGAAWRNRHTLMGWLRSLLGDEASDGARTRERRAAQGPQAAEPARRAA